MADHKISISVDANGNFTYSPSVLRVDLTGSDNVTWNCEQGPFSVVFTGQTPLDQLSAQGTEHGREWSTGKVDVDQEASPGHYHYAVAVFTNAHSPVRVHLDAACPEIIVN